MPHLVITKHVDAIPATVWAIVADFADVKWIPVAGAVEVEGDGIGMRRLIHGSGSKPVAETLTSLNPDRMELGYSIADNPLPVARFDALVSVRPAGDAAATVTWNVDYDPAGTTEADQIAAREAIEAVYGMMAGWLADASSTREAT
jgi:hypothetical protein